MEEQEAFDILSREYAQALDALRAIQERVELFATTGNDDAITVFVDDFTRLSAASAARARAAGLDELALWFDELVTEAQKCLHEHSVGREEPPL